MRGASSRRCGGCAQGEEGGAVGGAPEAAVVLHLSGIHVLWMMMDGEGGWRKWGLAEEHSQARMAALCPWLAHLSGIHTLYMNGCKLVTDAGLHT